MAAVLAVAVLLLCSSVRSEEVQGTVTQVKVSDLPTPPNDTAPVITNPTEGSSDTHSAVLANQVLESEDHGPLVLVDLARADNQEMSNMTTALPPPASDTAVVIPDGSDTVLAADTTTVPEGFDMNEFDAGPNITDSTTQATLTPDGSDTVLAADSTTVPEGFDMNEFDAGSNITDSTTQATLTPDGSDTVLAADTIPVPEGFDMNEFDEGSNIPDSTAQATLIPDGQDTVLAADTTTVPEGFDLNEFDEGSNTTVTTVQANQEDGPLVLAADTTPVPKGFDMNEFDEGSDSFAETNQDDGPLVLADTTPVPKGFDMNEFDEGSVGSFYDEPESLATTQDEGTLVPGFPTIGSSQDNTHGQGYGVQTYDAGSAGDDSFAAYQDDSSFADEGHIVECYPRMQDNSQGQDYGAQTYGGEDSFAAYNYNDDPSFADQGTLVQGYPGIGSSQDNSQGQGYGVQTYDAGSAGGGVGVVRPYGPFYGRP